MISFFITYFNIKEQDELSTTSKVYSSVVYEGVAFWYVTLGIGLLQYKLRTHGKSWHYTCYKTHLTMIHLCCPFQLKQNYNNALWKKNTGICNICEPMLMLCLCILNGNKTPTWPIMALKGTSQDQSKFFLLLYIYSQMFSQTYNVHYY